MIVQASVSAVCAFPEYRFSKAPRDSIELIAGHGVAGDVHGGATVKHRSRVARDPAQPNLRQVHLIHSELHEALRGQGFDIAPGDMGENITTRGLDVLGLPAGTRLLLGERAVIRVTGLRNPCSQLDAFRPGLTQACLERAADGELIRKAGIMAVVEVSGVVRPGDAIGVQVPAEPWASLQPV